MYPKARDLIKHAMFSDIAFWLWVDPDYVDGSFHCNVGVINLAFERSFFMGISTNISLKSEDLRDWFILKNPHIQKEHPLCEFKRSYRSGPWHPILLDI